MNQLSKFKLLGRLTGGMIMLFGLITSGCSSEYPPPAFEKKVDVSKPGVLHEGDFVVPYNGSFAPFKLEFGQPHTHYELVLQFADTVPGRLEREAKELDEPHGKVDRRNITHISLWKAMGFWGDDDHIRKLTEEQLKTDEHLMKYPGAPIRLRISLTPHTSTTKPIEYATATDFKIGRIRNPLATGQALDITLDLSTFAQYGNSGVESPQEKILVKLLRLELLGTYHLRVENLDPIDLPPGIQTTLIQRQGRSIK